MAIALIRRSAPGTAFPLKWHLVLYLILCPHNTVTCHVRKSVEARCNKRQTRIPVLE